MEKYVMKGQAKLLKPYTISLLAGIRCWNWCPEKYNISPLHIPLRIVSYQPKRKSSHLHISPLN